MSEHRQELEHDGHDAEIADEGREAGQEIVEVAESGRADHLLYGDRLQEHVLDFSINARLDLVRRDSGADGGDEDCVDLFGSGGLARGEGDSDHKHRALQCHRRTG